MASTKDTGAMPQRAAAPELYETERAVLGAVLLTAEMPKSLKVDLFYHPRHKEIFDALKARQADGRGLDLVSVSSDPWPGEMIAYLCALPGACPSPEALPHWIKELREVKYQRALYNWAKEVKVLAESRDWAGLAYLSAHRPEVEIDDQGGDVPAVPESTQPDPVVRKTISGLKKRGTHARTLATEVLRNDPRWKDKIWFDTFKRQIMSGSTQWRDSDSQRLSDWLSRTYRIEIPGQALDPVVRMIAEDGQKDALIEYLRSVTWDGVPRIENWLQWGMGVVDTPINRWIGQAWLVQAVARGLDPGCQADATLVFLGTQGEGKTSVFRALAGPFGSESKIDIGNVPRCYQQIAGVWLYELGEMAHFLGGRGTTEDAKTFLSSKRDDYIPLHAKYQVSVSRRCAFVGSTNRPEILRDPTGARRFWPVEAGVESQIDAGLIAELRDQLWAEAVACYDQKFEWWLPRERWPELKEVQADYQASDAWADKVVEWLDTPEILNTDTPITSRRVLTGAIGKDLDKCTKADEMRVGDIMASLGWRHKAVWNKVLQRKVNGYEKVVSKVAG
jgi:predicted P-loop ATPase